MTSTNLLPLAITMMAGPQILSAIIFVTAENPVKVSLGYVAAVAFAVTTGILLFYLLAGVLDNHVSLHQSSGESSTGKTIEIVLVGLLILACVKQYLGRETAEPPKWLGKLQGVTPGRAFLIGLLLIYLMPSDFVIMLTTGIHLKGNGAPFSDALPLIVATVLIASLPLLSYLLFKRRAEVAMPKMRDWMNANSWLVNILVFGIFIILILS
jgi:hypothetical protein